MSSPGDDLRLTGRVIWIGVLVIVVGLVLAFVFTGGFGLFSSLTADQRGQTGVRENTVGSGQYRIARYDEFFDKCNAIVGLDGQIVDAQKAVDDDTKANDTNSLFYDRQNLTALKNTRRTQATSYNADASKAGTAGQFRDSRLPDRIDPNQNGGVTCG